MSGTREGAEGSAKAGPSGGRRDADGSVRRSAATRSIRAAPGNGRASPSWEQDESVGTAGPCPVGQQAAPFSAPIARAHASAHRMASASADDAAKRTTTGATSRNRARAAVFRRMAAIVCPAPPVVGRPSGRLEEIWSSEKGGSHDPSQGSTVLLGLLSASAASGLAATKNLTDHLPLLTRRVEPKDFGINGLTVTTISATSFLPHSDDVGGFGVPSYFTSPGLGRFCQPNLGVHYYATLNVPAGSVIDFVGLNTTTNTDAVIGIAIWKRDRYAVTNPVVTYSVPAHGWDTDFAGPLGYSVGTNDGVEYVIDVEQAASPDYQYFGYVQVWWRRTVSPAPASPTFADVPPSDPAFQYIEALVAAGITAGCGGPNYCPDATLTRRQMAVFLAKALGLYWSDPVD